MLEDLHAQSPLDRQLAEALEARRAAEGVYRTLIKAGWSEFTSDLALVRVSQCAAHEDLGDMGAATTAADEANALYLELIESWGRNANQENSCPSRLQKDQQRESQSPSSTTEVLIKTLEEQHIRNIMRIAREVPYSSDTYAEACRLVAEYSDEQVLRVASTTALAMLEAKPGYTAALLERMLGVIQHALDQNPKDAKLVQKTERLNALIGDENQ